MKRGYIIVLTLLLLGMSIMTVTSVIQQSFAFSRQSRVVLNRERARTLALGSLAFAESQLSLVIPPAEKKNEQSTGSTAGTQTKKETDEKKQTQQSAEQTEKKEQISRKESWKRRIIGLVNKVQKIQLNQQDDGIDATITYYISSENGKLNIAQLSAGLHKQTEKESQEESVKTLEGGKDKAAEAQQKDAQKQEKAPIETVGKNGAQQTKSQDKGKRKPDLKGFITKVDELVKKETSVPLKKVLEESFKQLKRAPEDASELIPIEGFAPLKEFIFQPLGKSKEQPKQLYAMDLFTTATGSAAVNPWLLTPSTIKVLGFTDTPIGDDILQYMRPRSMNWKNEWDNSLGKTYNKKFADIAQEIRDQFAAEFETDAFSVISYCTVGAITIKLCALLTKEQPAGKTGSDNIIFKVSKIYWL